MKRLLGVMVLFALGCSEFRDPGDLHYARALAVRADPPRIAPGERARIELLVTGDDGIPLVRPPDGVAPAAPQPGQPAPPPQAAQLISQENGSWYVTAPPAEVLAQLRQALGLPPESDAPIPLPLAISLTVEGQPRPSEKVVWLGGSAANPSITAMSVDGQPMGEVPLAVSAASPHALTGSAAGEGVLSYSWYTAFGELKKYREPAATLEKAAPGEAGAVVLVVRDDRGGVTWRLGALRAE